MSEVLYKGKVYRIVREDGEVLTISRFLEVLEIHKKEVIILWMIAVVRILTYYLFHSNILSYSE